MLVPGGFGQRGIEGKIKAISYARTNKIPFLGLCLGMQCAVIEFARSVCGLKSANSPGFKPKTSHPVISLLEEQKRVKYLGGTMRLGLYPCALQPDTIAYKAYGKPLVHERHRHRFELNNSYRELLQKNGMRFSGLSPDGRLVEIAELVEHPFMVGTQFHPE